MKVTVLGCGASAGVPMLGPVWGRCDPTNPKNRRRRVSIVVESRGVRVLVDTPADLRDQCLDSGIERIDAVVYTHCHADHVHGLDDLRGFNYHRGGPLDVYGDPGTLRDIKARFGYAFEHIQTAGPWYRPSLIAHEINGPFAVGGLEIVPFEQRHAKSETLGLRFGRFAYSTDVNELPDSAFAALAGIDCWIVDCARYTPSPGHAHLALSLSWIERVRPKRAIFTHMAGDFDYETLRKQLPPGVEPAYDGMVIELDE